MKYCKMKQQEGQDVAGTKYETLYHRMKPSNW